MFFGEMGVDDIDKVGPILRWIGGNGMFNLDLPKIGSPRNEFFWNIWMPSENFLPALDHPHEGKSVHINGHEATTKGISGVHSGNWMTWFWSISMPRVDLT